LLGSATVFKRSHTASLENEIVVGIDDNNCSDLFVILDFPSSFLLCVPQSFALCRQCTISSASVILFGRILFWNAKCDQTLVEGVVICVLQFNEHFVRTGGKTHQDDWLTARIGPYP